MRSIATPPSDSAILDRLRWNLADGTEAPARIHEGTDAWLATSN